MPGIWERTRRIFTGVESRAPMPFTVRCPCGESISGMRQDDPQILTCPSCRGSLFVFPQSPLPPPMENGRQGRRRARRGRAARSAAAVAVPRPRLAERLRTASARGASAVGRLIPPKSWFTTPKLVGMGVALIACLTIWWQVRQSQLAEARAIAVPEARRGLTALSSGDLDEAHERLKRAVEAMDFVGEPFPNEERYRQAYREVAIVKDLLPEPLEALLTRSGGNAHDIDRNLRGKAIVLDAEVESLGTGAWRIDYATLLGDQVVALHPDGLSLFGRLGLTGKTRLVFGARIDKLESDALNRPQLKLQFDSGVLFTEGRLYSALSLSSDPTVQDVRQRQKDWLAERLGIGIDED